jgi:hypothetical protein
MLSRKDLIFDSSSSSVGGADLLLLIAANEVTGLMKKVNTKTLTSMSLRICFVFCIDELKK